MKCATLAYVPPEGIGHPKVFLENVRKFKTRHPVILYSDSPEYKDMNFQVASPDRVRNPKVPWAVNNCAFFFGLKIAEDLGLDYFCYLESDCRVNGKHWDEVLDDWAGGDTVVAGSPVFYNMSNAGGESLVAATDFACTTLRLTTRPVPWYGGSPQSNAKPCVYPNGAGGIYHTKTIVNLFPGFQLDIGRYAQKCTAWDMEIGFRLWDRFGVELFDRFVTPPEIFSCYGDTIHSFEERTQALVEGRASIIHQVKTAWTI